MNQAIKIRYPNPADHERAVLVMDEYKIPVTYDLAQHLVKRLAMMERTNRFSPIRHEKGYLPLDRVLAAEIYAALVEVIVEVEIGADLAALDFEEQPLYAVN